MTFFSGRLFKFLLGGLVFLFLLITIKDVYTQPPPPPPPTYSITAHGNSTSGVNRQAVTGTPYPDASPYSIGHCGHCHEMHASVGGVEPTPPAAEGASSYAVFRTNYGTNRNELCYACHETFTLSGMTLSYGRYGIYQGKTKYTASIHNTSSYMVWPETPPLGPTYSDYGNCHNCHNPHGYRDSTGVIPSMLFARDSKTGDSPNYEMGCEACHDGSPSAANDIKTQLNKTYRHPTHTYNNRHTLPETGESEGGHSFGNPPTYDKRHAECVDCHNPHGLGTNGTTHTPQTSGNAVSDVLKNVWGVEPTWPSIWTQPTTFTVRKPPTYTGGSLYEYQICFKCHSYYGLGTLTNAVSTIIGPSFTNITDQAWEFNVNNKSAHPVVVGLNSQTGSYAPKALASTQMSSPWTTVGTQTMYCSDCHGADDESTSAKGPHGSIRKYMLKGTGKYWPTNSGGTLWNLSDITTTGPTDLFCRNCHPIRTSSGWGNNVHSNSNHDVSCVTCHIAVPHGSKRSRLIGYSSDPAPYDYNNNSLLVTGYKKAAGRTSYDTNDCSASYSGCTGGMAHSTSISGPDP